jgi:biotin carboxylase
LLSSAPRILVTDTNRWPVVARLVIAFRKARCETAVLCSMPDHPVQKLSGVESVFCYDGFEPIPSIRRAIEVFNPDLIVPCCDRGVQHLHTLYSLACSEGNSGSKIADLIERSLGSSNGFHVVSSRNELIEVAESEGIRVPSTTPIETEADLHRWGSEVAPPWFLKADGTWGGQGVTAVGDISAGKRFFQQFDQHVGWGHLLKRLILNRDRGWALSDWKHSKRSVIAQAMIDGRPANCAVVCWQGKLLAGIAVEVIKASGPTGPASIVQVVPGAEMIEAAAKLARRLSISGFFGLDFVIENKTGLAYLIEMNPRCTPPSPLPLNDGRNLVQALCAHLMGHSVQMTEPGIEQRVIAYFPAGVKGMQAEAPSPADSVYVDMPAGEPALVEALLHPKSRRSTIGRVIDWVYHKRPQDARFAATSVAEVRTSNR